MKTRSPATRAHVPPLVVLSQLRARRNAQTHSSLQERLRADYHGVMQLHGPRPEQGANARALPYLPMYAAGTMLAWMRGEATKALPKPITAVTLVAPLGGPRAAYDWLTSPPESAVQPGLIRKHLATLAAVVGKVDGKGHVVDPNPRSFEPMPAQVAKRLRPFLGNLDIFAPPDVLTVEATESFLYAMEALAIHLDVLRGQEPRLTHATEATREAVNELPDTLYGAAAAVGGAARSAIQSATYAAGKLKLVGLGLAGLAALWVVSR